MNRLLSCLAVVVALASASVWAELPLISDARITQPPPGAPVAGGFLTINNTSDEDLVLTGASSEDIGRVELHLSEVIDDVAKMTHLDQVLIPAGSSLEFKHGSYHLMLMDLEEPLIAGDEVQITINSSAGPIPVTLPVLKPGMEAHGAMKHAEDEGDKKHGDSH